MTKIRFIFFTFFYTFIITGCSLISKNDYSDMMLSYEDINTTDTIINNIDNFPASDNHENYFQEETDNENNSVNLINSNNIFDDSDIVLQESLTDKYLKQFSELAPTTSMTFEELVGDNGDYELPIGFPESDTYRIIVDKYYQVVMVYSKDNNGEFTVPVRYMLCTTGADSTPTPTGTYNMKSYRVRFALFKDTAVYGQYWSLITGRIYFHSILYSEKDASTYTSSYKRLGTNVSHGCIRLTVPDARWIWYNCAPGTEVIIQSGSSSDKDTALIKEQLILAEMPDVVPDSLKNNSELPYTDNWTIDEVPHNVEFIQGSQN